MRRTLSRVAGQSPAQSMARACRETPLRMSNEVAPSVLTLGWTIDSSYEDWPTTIVTIDGVNPVAEAAPDWGGFDPGDLFAEDSVLLPQDRPRRIGIWRCSCGEAGCGVIAPVISGSLDGRWITWSDPRDYVGVFTGPLPPRGDMGEGTPWGLPTYRFDREQYVTEVRRATADRSWETPRRVTARLLADLLRGSRLPGEYVFRWAAPLSEGGYGVSHERRTTALGERCQELLVLDSSHSEPVTAARDMARRLLAVAAEDRAESFREPW